MGEENESVSWLRDPSDLFAVEIDCVCSVLDVGNKVPCAKCKCMKFKDIDNVRVDLLRKGFMLNYETRVQHGEGTLENLSRYALGRYDATNEEPTMNSWNENVVRYESMVADAFPFVETFEDNEEEEQ
ncbi:hypothetical protein PIB30_062592 [Stylosanthes scabra]|uniref:Transposase-associated domain-containing protein n=1 Tax=Stylosanthes scabra TaxID=79078 RepID=A0ABU6VJK5_9FABA|nr:hypothetical protein [Stylosanthes scabra]